MPDLRQLRAFVAVAERLSFTRAAEQLHLTQQTVSKTVVQLERELGVELLERTTRDVRLTAAGTALLEPGRAVLVAADAAFARAREAGRGLTGPVRVGVSPAIGPADRDAVVRALRAAGPDVSVGLQDVRPGTLRLLLRAREIDLALTRISGTEDRGLDHAELRPSAMALCVPANHRLAAATAPVPLAAVDGERLLSPSPRGTPYTELLLARCAAAGATMVHVESSVTGGDAVPRGVVEHDAVALVPTGTAAPTGTVLLALQDDLTVPLVLLWPAGPPTPAVTVLLRALG